MRYVICLIAAICILLPAGASPNDGSGVLRDLQAEGACLEQAPPPNLGGSNPAVQAGLWTAHLTQYLNTHPELSVEQRSAIQEARELVAGGLHQRLISSNDGEVAEARQMVASFEARALELFSNEAYAEVFIKMKRPAASRTRLSGGEPQCDCNRYTGECGDSCVFGDCYPMPTGCGALGHDACFGLCW